MDQFLTDFLEQHRLPESFRSTAENYYSQLSERIFEKLDGTTFLLGINGSQGSGKSTLADFIRQYLMTVKSKRVVNLSIDDIYLTKAEREYLGRAKHPLLKTRGVPGTHDVELGLEVILKLKHLREGESYSVPRFDKAADDRFDRNKWERVEGPVDLVVFEGWCVGSVPEEEAALERPVNGLEASEDPHGIWRDYVNRQLATEYHDLFDILDALILLKAPSFESVFEWRLEQERKLALSLAAVTGNDVSGIMSEDEIDRFIQHYERLTRHNLRVLPEHADAVLELGTDHQVHSASYRSL